MPQISHDNYLRQACQAEAAMAEIDRYARSIGCEVIHEEIIIATPEQARLMAAKSAEVLGSRSAGADF